MNPVEQMKVAMPSFTKAEAKAANFFLENPTAVLSGSITSIAKDAGASNSAIIRMAQKLGYDGYGEFSFSLKRTLLASGGEEDTGVSNCGDAAALISTYERYLEMIPRRVSEEQLRAIAGLIEKANRICVWGINRTAQSAMQLSNRLTRLGYFNKMTDDQIVMLDDAELMGNDDVCFIFTVNGRGTTRYADCIDTMADRDAKIVLITMNDKLPYAKKASELVVLPWISRDSSTNFYEDQIVVYMFIEILLTYVARLG